MCLVATKAPTSKHDICNVPFPSEHRLTSFLPQEGFQLDLVRMDLSNKGKPIKERSTKELELLQADR